jgi:hypothetical protein
MEQLFQSKEIFGKKSIELYLIEYMKWVRGDIVVMVYPVYSDSWDT